MNHNTHFGLLYDENEFIAQVKRDFGITVISDLPQEIGAVAQIPTFERFLGSPRGKNSLNGGVGFTEYTKFWTSVYLKYDAVQFHCLWQYMNEPPGYVELRNKMIKALVPAPMVQQTIGKLIQKHPNMVAVHARTEGDWLNYCPTVKGIHTNCFISTRHIVKILLKQLKPKSSVYILTGSVTSIALFKKLLSPHNITVISKHDWDVVLLNGFQDLTEYMAVLDQSIAVSVDIFYASWASSFSKSICKTREDNNKISYKLNDFVKEGYYPYDQNNRYVPQFDGDESV